MKLQPRELATLIQRDIQHVVPLFLGSTLLVHPITSQLPLRRPTPYGRRLLSTSVRRRLELLPASKPELPSDHAAFQSPGIPLPLSCPGCGAPTQSVMPNEAGFYTLSRKGLQKHLKPATIVDGETVESRKKKIGKRTARLLGSEAMIGKCSQFVACNRPVRLIYSEKGLYTRETEPPVPICDRCHHLLHHRIGVSIQHPSIQSIEDTIDESPHKYNHIYHVLDAADFPMSLLPNLHRTLDAHLRSRNRRSKDYEFKRNRTVEMSFIITRSDLLAPIKEQVDTMMPTLIEILRDALGSTGENIRLGNVRCVSSKRGWWTKEVKESIWDRGGGGWLVGKVNVGKSNLFESVYPKGRDDTINFDRARNEARNKDFQMQSGIKENGDFADPLSLLPPPQEETKYPVMPIISELPGTTASPIRIPFGNGKGELIDLPGLSRASLERYVLPENRLDLVMKRRIVPEKIVVTWGRSLLLGGGLIRITPKTADQVFMMHAFVPLHAHLTSTLKATEMQAGERESGIASILDPSAREKIASSGIFQLKWDVTRKHAGPLTRKDAVGLQSSRLPFTVYSTDILIEGCGWVEVVAQVRKARRKQVEWVDPFSKKSVELPEPEMFPEIEVFTPKGKFVGQRRPLGASLTGGPKERGANERTGRPRRSLTSMRKSRDGRGLGMHL